MELSNEQKDALDELADLGCEVVFVQYDQRFRDHSYFHLSSLYPNLLGSDITLEVTETVFEDKSLSELDFEVVCNFKEYDTFDFTRVQRAVECTKSLKALLSTMIYYKGSELC